MGADNRPRIRGAKGAADVGPKFDLPFIPARYSVVKELGRGGMGVVYLAKDTKAGRQVAIKVLSPNPSAAGEGENDATRFRREAKELSALDHPNIVALLDSGEAQERQYMVMEYVGGGNLRNVMEKDDLPATLGVFMRICDGLEYIHARGIVHRDLKPDNILMTADGQPKITDFGLVRRIEQQTRHTQVGSILGTGSYMPPEQIMSNDVGPLADLYSLGVCLFQAATGRLPFIEEQEFKLLQHHIKTPPPVPSELKPGLHPKLDELILKLMAKHPEKRPQSAAETAQLIQEVLAHMSGAAGRTAEVTPVALVGRGTELEDLSRRLGAERAAILLSAPAGTGRSVLLGRLAKDLQHRRTVWARPAPCGQGLRELWEQLGRPPEEPAMLWDLGREEALAGALVRHLAREVPTLLLVDDFERLDSLSQRVLLLMARRPPPPGVTWVVSSTPDRVPAFPALQEFPLPPLSPESQQLLDKAWLGAEPGPRLTEFLQGKQPRRLWLNCVRPGIAQGDLTVIPSIDQTELALDLLRRQPAPVREAAGLAACLLDPVDTSLVPEFGLLVQLGVLELAADRRRAVFTLPALREKLRALTARPPVHLRLAELLKEPGYEAERSCHLALAGQPAREVLVQADRLTEGGYYREALDLWSVARMVCQGPEQGVALSQAARCRAELGGAAASVEELRSLPESPTRNWALAHSLKLAGRADEARPLLTSQDPRTLELRAELAPTPAEAAELLAQAESATRGLAGSDERLQALAARYSLEAGKPDVVPQLVRSNGRPDARRLLAEAYLQMRQFTEAIGAFQTALAEASGLPPAWEAALWKGLAQAQQGASNSADAVKASQEAARVLKVAGDRGLGQAMLELARLQSDCGQHYEAEKTLREIPDGSGNLLLGLTMMAQNRPAEALSYLEAAVDDNGDAREQVELLCALAQANVSRHREEEATEAAEKALRRAKDLPHPWPATARIACGRAAIARMDWPSARKHLRAAQELKPPPELAKELDALQQRIPEQDEPLPEAPPRNPQVKIKRERKAREEDDDDDERRGLPKWVKLGAAVLVPFVLAAVPIGFSGLEIVTSPPGALVIVSGQPVGRSPVSVWKPPGRVEVWVRLDGYAEVRRAVQVSLGEREKVQLTLEKSKRKN